MNEANIESKTIAIDIRLLGKKRTGDEMVFFHLTKEVISLDRENRYVLLTDETDAVKIGKLASRLGCADKENVSIISLPSRNRFSWNFFVLPKYLLEERIDVLHTQYILPLFSPKRTKIVVHIHDVSFRAYPELIGLADRFFLALLIPRSLRRAALIVAPSQFTKDEIIKYYGTEAEKIIILPNAIGTDFLEVGNSDPQNERAVRAKYHLPEQFIVFVGTLQPRKNIPFLIEVFAVLRKRLPEMKLVLVSNRAGHHIDTRVDETIKKLGLEKEVIFPGFIDQEDLPEVVGLASVFVFPSLYEGFGIPLLEAMSQSVPTLASDIPSLREVAGASTLYFDPTSIANCEEKLYTLLIDQKEKNMLIERGKARIGLFSWRRSATLLLNEYNKL